MSSETTRKGNLAEQNVILNLMNRGYEVFKPISSDGIIDLIIVRNQNQFETVQVKYCTMVDNILEVKLETGSTVIENRVLYSNFNINWIAVFCPDTNTTYYLPNSLWKNHAGKIYLRIKGAGNSKSNWAKDYTNI